MATKKNVSKTRKITRAKATKKSSVRSGRKAPGVLPNPAPRSLPIEQAYS